MSAPAIVFSLDLEYAWGVQDWVGDDAGRYGNLFALDEVVDGMLERFSRYQTRVTWAIVGALACRDWTEWEERAPAWPRYHDPALGFRQAWRDNDPDGRLHFAPGVVERIHDTPGQELGSHTFSHAYLTEPGFTRQDAEADAHAMATLFEDRWGVAPISFIPPRIRVAHLDVLQAHGIRGWRANPRPFFWQIGGRTGDSKPFRVMRALDALLPLGRRALPPVADAHRASFFVRYAFPPRLWPLHMRRIEREARRLRQGDTLHLWWHPHDLGAHPKRSLDRLSELLDRLGHAAPSGTRFANMGDIL